MPAGLNIYAHNFPNPTVGVEFDFRPIFLDRPYSISICISRRQRSFNGKRLSDNRRETKYPYAAPGAGRMYRFAAGRPGNEPVAWGWPFWGLPAVFAPKSAIISTTAAGGATATTGGGYGVTNGD